jgi:hypothetical protein
LSIISLEETFAYSGYNTMPANFFIGSIARRVEQHVFSNGSGNFGPWGILDWICGTSVEESIVDELIEDEAIDLGDLTDRLMEQSKRTVKSAKRRNRRRRDF